MTHPLGLYDMHAPTHIVTLGRGELTEVIIIAKLRVKTVLNVNNCPALLTETVTLYCLFTAN